jgi:hypothetical protein
MTKLLKGFTPVLSVNETKFNGESAVII